MKALNRSMLMRLYRALEKAETKVAQDEALCQLDLKRAKGQFELRLAESALRDYRNPKMRDRFIATLVRNELERYFAAKYLRTAKKNGDDTNIATVCEEARQQAALILKPLL